MGNGKLFIPFLILIAFFSGSVGHIFAQEESDNQLRLRLSRDFGFGLGGQMQGSFTYHATGPDNLVRVLFLMDDEIIGQDETAPFRLSFNTSDYDLGTHTLSAVGITPNGRELGSNKLVRQFLPRRLAFWLVAAAVVLVVGFRVASSLLTRQRGSAKMQRPSYGALGGAVCPNCGKSFGLHWWGINLMATRIDRCPHCRKWNAVSRASPDELRKAERLTREDDGGRIMEGVQDSSEGERLRRRLEESRYEDS